MTSPNWHPIRGTRSDAAWITPLARPSDFTFMIAAMLEHWSWLEDTMCRTYAILLECEKEEAIPKFYSVGSGGGRLRLLSDAIRDRMPDGVEKVELIDLVEAVKADLVPFRNDIVHGNFEFAHDLGGGFIRIRTYDRLAKKITYREINRAALREHLDAVSLASSRLSKANTTEVVMVMTVMDRRFD